LARSASLATHCGAVKQVRHLIVLARGVRRLLLASVPRPASAYGYPVRPARGHPRPPCGRTTRDGRPRHRRSHQAAHSTLGHVGGRCSAPAMLSGCIEAWREVCQTGACATVRRHGWYGGASDTFVRPPAVPDTV